MKNINSNMALKKNKIIILLLLIILLIVFNDVKTMADEKTIHMPKLGLSITIPDDYYILTRDISSSNPGLSALNMTQSECKKMLEDQNIYIDAVAKDFSAEIIVKMTDSCFTNINLFPESTLEYFLSQVAMGIEQNGITVTDKSIYENEQTKFLLFKLEKEDNGSKTICNELLTFYDDMAIDISITSFTGEITFLQALDFYRSFTFDKAPSDISLPEKNTESFKYDDPETEISFIVPPNWETAKLDKKREFLDVKFQSTDSTSVIVYGSVDAWSYLSEKEQKEYKKREKFNLTTIPEKEIKELFDSILDEIDESIPASVKYEKTEINGIEYIYFEYTTDLEFIEIPIKSYFTIINGYMYYFSYSNLYNDDAHIDDFNELLKSVQYGNNDIENEKIFIIIIILALVLLFIYTVILIINKQNKISNSEEKRHNIIKLLFSKKSKQSKNKDENKISPISQDRTNDNESDKKIEKKLYCRKCGHELLTDSEFCYKCGTKVIRL